MGLTLAWPGAHGYRPHPGRPHPVRDGLGEGGEGRITDWWECGYSLPLPPHLSTLAEP